MYGDQTNISLISTFCRKRGNESAVRRKNEHNEEIIKLGQTPPTPVGSMPGTPWSTCMQEQMAQSTGEDTL